MTPNPTGISRSQQIQPHSQNTTAAPAWWRAEQERFHALAQARLEVHLHEKAAARKAASVLATALLVAVSVYSVDAISGAGIPAASGLLTFFLAIAIPVTLAWLVDRRLVQQLGNIDLRSRLWLDLVDAVKHGCVDLSLIESVSSAETEIESFLRREISIAARFLSSNRRMAPHLPLFGYCFTLENV